MEAFNLKFSAQCTSFENEVKARMYTKLAEVSNNAVWLRFVGIGVGIASAILTIAFRIAQIGEALIKAFGNIFGAICSKGSDWRLGFWQLFVLLPLSLVDMLVSPFYGLIGTVATTVCMAAEPVIFVTKRIAIHAIGVTPAGGIQNSLVAHATTV